MATFDGFVSQQGVVGHLKAGDLKKEKFVDDYGFGDFGSDDCSFLAISSEWIDIPDDCVPLDKSKLILLKKKMKNNANSNNGMADQKKKKRRRKRRKKIKNINRKAALDVDFGDSIYVPSSLSNAVLEIEVADGIGIPSLLKQTTLDIQTNDGLFFPSNQAVPITGVCGSSLAPSGSMELSQKAYSSTCVDDLSSGDNPSVIGCLHDNGYDSYRSQQSQQQQQHQNDPCTVTNVVNTKFMDHGSDTFFGDNDYSSSQSSIFSASVVSSNSMCSCSSGRSINGSASVRKRCNGVNKFTLQSLKDGINDWKFRMSKIGGIAVPEEASPECYSFKLFLNEMIELEKLFGDQIQIGLKSLDELKLIVFNWGGRKVVRLPRSRFKFTNIDDPFDDFKPITAALHEFMDYDQRFGTRLGVDKSTYNKLILQCVGVLDTLLCNTNEIRSINSHVDTNVSCVNSNGGYYQKYRRKRGRKKRKYKMVFKNKLQSVQFKQFGNNQNDYVDNGHCNTVVLPKLVTARAPLCAPTFSK